MKTSVTKSELFAFLVVSSVKNSIKRDVLVVGVFASFDGFGLEGEIFPVECTGYVETSSIFT